MGRNRWLIPGVILFSAVVVTAQERPDFTGTWKADTGPKGCTRTDKMVQQGIELKVDWSSHCGIAVLGGEETYRLDGTERFSGESPHEHWSMVTWQGTALLFLRVRRDRLHVTFTRETWTLSDDGKTLTKTRRIIGPDGVEDGKSVFHKQ